MPVLAILTSNRADPTPTVQLGLDGIQEMLARDNCVLWHLVSAEARVLIQVDLLTGNDLGISGLGFEVLRVLEDGREKGLLLLGLLLLFLLLILFGFSLLGATLLLTIIHLILHLLDVAVIEKNESS